jgi:hypothetical protein
MLRGASCHVQTNFWQPFASILLDLAAEHQENLQDKYHVLGLISLLMQTQGTINLKVKDDMWKKLYTNPFVAIFQIGGQEYLERLTATSGDDSILDTLAEEIGLPKNFSRLTDALI